MRSLIFEKKYEISVKQFNTLEQINRFVEEKTGRKLEYKRSDNLILAKGGSVFKLNTIDSGKVIDKILSQK